MTEPTPQALLVYYTYTRQTRAVIDAVADGLISRGFEVTKAEIEFTDPRYRERFTRFPLQHAYLDIIAMLPAQLRRAVGEIRIPDEARTGAYDLVVVGSATWWLTTCMPIRSYLMSEEAGQVLGGTPFAAVAVCRRYWRNNLKTVQRLGSDRGGDYLDGSHFTFAGGQVRSLLSLISYLGLNRPGVSGDSLV